MKIIVDTEYTTDAGWRENGWKGEGQHREIVQIAAIAVNNDFEEKFHFDVLVKPKINPILSPFFVDLTGIMQEEVDANGLKFREALDKFFAFCSFGNIPVICMNGDGLVFRENCALNKQPFPFSKKFHRLAPFLHTLGIDGKSSGDLHTLTKTPIEGHTHNALHDVRSMAAWLREAKAEGRFTSMQDLPTTLPEA